MKMKTKRYLYIAGLAAVVTGITGAALYKRGKTVKKNTEEFIKNKSFDSVENEENMAKRKYITLNRK